MRPYNSAKLLRQANPRRQLNFSLNNMTPEQTELVLLRLLAVGAPVAPRMARTAREYESVVGIDNHVGACIQGLCISPPMLHLARLF